ncbi:MAG: 23S rRNA (pseudouridine(1915)-N(3))-methyltransferase RlmH [Ruminiclostridium sp.]|nr:23S rRNA (pseudouridine(1915)-N(3))-methyltransferase RlmH [Ruminiclostridium sp.]
MVIKLITVGKLKEKYFREAAEEYEKRLGAYCKLEVCELEPARLSDDPSDGDISRALEKESADILRKIPAGSFVVPLCVEGGQLTSEGFAKLIGREAAGGRSTFVFIIGGSYGLSDKVKTRGDLRLGMSEMTFPHRLARIMLTEQLYRAFTLMSNGKYHK